MQYKLFDDKSFIDKTVITKKKWIEEFQKLCDSEEIRKESDFNGLNACGYWFACDYCDGDFTNCACANALIRYFNKIDKKIDYQNISHEYLEKLIRGDY